MVTSNVEMSAKVRIARVGTNTKILYIPQGIASVLGWRYGDTLEIALKKRCSFLTVRKVKRTAKLAVVR